MNVSDLVYFPRRKTLMREWNFVGKEAAQKGKSGALQEFVQNHGSVQTEDGLELPHFAWVASRTGSVNGVWTGNKVCRGSRMLALSYEQRGLMDGFQTRRQNQMNHHPS